MILGQRYLADERIGLKSQEPYLQSTELVLLFAVMFLGVLCRLIYISQPFVDDWSWRQADVAMIAENFYLHGFNIFYPQINWAGNSPGYVGTEFPLVPFLASMLYLFFGIQDWIGRSISIGFFALSAPFFYLLVRKISNERSAMFAVGVYTLAPLSVFSSRSFMPDMASLSFSIVAFYLFTEWLRRKKTIWLFAATCAATSLAILVKLPAIIIGVPLLYLAWQEYGAKLVLRRDLWAFAGLSLALPLAWYYHTYLVSISHYPHHMFGSGGIAIESLGWYLSIVHGAAASGLTLIVSAAMVIGIFLAPETKFGRLFHWWLLAILLFLFVAGQGHRHPWYLLPIVPVAAALAGRAFDFVLSRIPQPAQLRISIIFGLTFLFSLSYLSFVYVKPLYEPLRMAALHAGRELNRIVPPEALIAVADGGDPTCLYYSKRKGWHYLEDFGNAPRDSQEAIAEVDRLRKQGASYLIFIRYTFRWLKQYDHFRAYLNSRYRRVKDTQDYIIFDLTNANVG
jgi:hypothetical protein